MLALRRRSNFFLYCFLVSFHFLFLGAIMPNGCLIFILQNAIHESLYSQGSNKAERMLNDFGKQKTLPKWKGVFSE